MDNKIPNLKESFLVKCGVTHDKPFFLYKGKMWIKTDKDIARGNTYGFCSFDEKLLNNEIKPEEILAISFSKAMTILEEAFLENKSLVKTLEKYNEEMIDLRKENQDLLNTVIEAQKVIKNVLGSRR